MDDVTWIRDTLRWGQVNFNEHDPRELDVARWAKFWKRSALQGVTLNAGGAVAYYPTDVPLHRRARFLDGRDLFGETVAAAKQLGLRVLGRLDPAFADQSLYDAHPDWFLTGPDGQAVTQQAVIKGAVVDRSTAGAFSIGAERIYLTCFNGPYYEEFLPAVMTEVLERYDVDGFFTNGWPLLGAMPPVPAMACHCPHCSSAWKARTGAVELPVIADPADGRWRAYVAFVQDSVERVQERLRAWTKALKPAATFVAVAFPSPATALRWPRWIELVDMLGSDAQGRRTLGGPTDGAPAVWEAGFQSELLRSVAGGKPILRFCATYSGAPLMRHAAKPAAEILLVMAEALAHGERPKWHTLGGRTHDRRWMDPVADYFGWLASIESYLVNERSVADVGVLWSPAAGWLDAWSPDEPRPRPSDALLGWYLALLQARLPFELVHAELLGDLDRYRVLVVPAETPLGDETIAALRRFADGGGAIVAGCRATGRTSWGDPLPSLGIGSLLGVEPTGEVVGPLSHSYLRVGAADRVSPLLDDLGDTDVVAGGRWLSPFRSMPGTETVATWIPDYPINPTHAVHLDPAATDVDVLALRDDGHRSVYLGMDLDAAYHRHRHPDHGRLLANAVRWAAGDRWSVTVEGSGLLDVRAWRQAGSLTVHLVNLTTPDLYGQNATAIATTGPQQVRVRLAPGEQPAAVHLLRRGEKQDWQIEGDGVVSVTVGSVDDFEVVAVDFA